jgi:uncharacterized protein
MQFEWDEQKADANVIKHGINFDEAASVFLDLNSRTVYDERNRDREDRYLTVGFSRRGRLIVVWHTDRGDAIRIIGARFPDKREASEYPNG